MGKDDILKRLHDSVLEQDSEKAAKATEAAIQAGIAPKDIIDKALVPSIRRVGDKFDKMEIFLPELMLASDAVKAAMKFVLPLLSKGDKIVKSTVVIATVQGDVHEIGKNIVSSMLMARGFNVIDMGVDVKTSLLVEEARKSSARTICASALMSSTMGSQKDIVDHLSALGDRKRYAVLIGGGPTSKEWADEIGADGWGKDANDAVKLAERYSKGR